MKVYVVFEQILNCDSNYDESVLVAIFSKEEYAERYCDKNITKYWYDEVNVDEELEELLNEADN